MTNRASPILIARRGLMFVLSSPSGAGKTTISRRMLEMDGELRMSVSVTTRRMRPGEVHAKDYYFVDAPEFERMIAQNELLEHARVFENYYGTPAQYVHETLSAGKDVLFDIDWQGTRQLAITSRSDLVSVFILPPSLTELERRLKSRAQDSDEVVKKRMAKAVEEISHWGEYDYVVINHNVEETLARVLNILKAERLKRVRQVGLTSFVEGLR